MVLIKPKCVKINNYDGCLHWVREDYSKIYMLAFDYEIKNFNERRGLIHLKRSKLGNIVEYGCNPYNLMSSDEKKYYMRLRKLLNIVFLYDGEKLRTVKRIHRKTI